MIIAHIALSHIAGESVCLHAYYAVILSVQLRQKNVDRDECRMELMWFCCLLNIVRDSAHTSGFAFLTRINMPHIYVKLLPTISQNILLERQIFKLFFLSSRLRFISFQCYKNLLAETWNVLAIDNPPQQNI